MLGACAAAPKHTLTAQERELAGGRAALVVIAQSEIRSSINRSVAAGVAVGGLVGALIDSAVNSSRTGTAEDTITPLRAPMLNYPFDDNARRVAEVTLRQIPWLGVSSQIDFSKDASPAGLQARLDATPGAQLVMASFGYSLNPDFSTLELALTLDIMPTRTAPGEKPESRLKPDARIYTQNFACHAAVSKGDDKAANVAAWADQDARRTKLALDKCLIKLRDLALRSLKLAPEELAQLQKAPKQTIDGVSGVVLQQDAEGTAFLGLAGRWVYEFKYGAI